MNKPSFNLFPTGVGGVLYPPGSLNRDVVKKELFLELCPLADDIWFKAMGLLNGTKTIMVGDTSKSFLAIKSAQKSSLWRENVGNNKNDPMFFIIIYIKT